MLELHLDLVRCSIINLMVCYHSHLELFQQVLQISDILEYNGACNDRSVVILLVFLSSQLIVKKNMVMPDVLLWKEIDVDVVIID